MNEAALIKIQAIAIGLDNKLLSYIADLIAGKSNLSDEHLTILIEHTERELAIYEYLLKLIIADTNKN
jgi:hypothetical protein